MVIYVNSDGGYGSRFNVHFNSEGNYSRVNHTVMIIEAQPKYNQLFGGNVSYWDGDIEYPNGMNIKYSPYDRETILRNYHGTMIFPESCKTYYSAFKNSRIYGNIVFQNNSIRNASSAFDDCDFIQEKPFDLRGKGNDGDISKLFAKSSSRVTQFICPDIYFDNSFNGNFALAFSSGFEPMQQISETNVHIEGSFISLNMYGMFLNAPYFNGKLDFNFDVLTNLQVSNMLKGCSNFNQPVTFPNNIYNFTGLSCFRDCINFNSTIDLPENSTGTLQYMLMGCTEYNKPFNFPENSNFFADSFFTGCSNFNSPVVIPESSNISGIVMRNCVNWHSELYYYPQSPSHIFDMEIDYNVLTHLCNVSYDAPSNFKNGVSLQEAFHGKIYKHDTRNPYNAETEFAVDRFELDSMGIFFTVYPNTNGNNAYLEIYKQAYVDFHDSVIQHI